jgi:hypothetical protein
MIRILNMFLLATVTLMSCKDSEVLNKQDVSEIIYSTDSTTVKFEGIITNAKNDCWADGMCSIEVNHKWWIVIAEGLGDPSIMPVESGKATGIRFTKNNESIGKVVAVYVKIRNKNLLTLDGSNEYYVKVVEPKILKE